MIKSWQTLPTTTSMSWSTISAAWVRSAICKNVRLALIQQPEHETAVMEFSVLVKDLHSAGLNTEVRHGYDQSLLVFVQAPRELLGNTVYKSR